MRAWIQCGACCVIRVVGRVYERGGERRRGECPSARATKWVEICSLVLHNGCVLVPLREVKLLVSVSNIYYFYSPHCVTVCEPPRRSDVSTGFRLLGGDALTH